MITIAINWLAGTGSREAVCTAEPLSVVGQPRWLPGRQPSRVEVHLRVRIMCGSLPSTTDRGTRLPSAALTGAPLCQPPPVIFARIAASVTGSRRGGSMSTMSYSPATCSGTIAGDPTLIGSGLAYLSRNP